jgi:hypothetical protein
MSERNLPQLLTLHTTPRTTFYLLYTEFQFNFTAKLAENRHTTADEASLRRCCRFCRSRLLLHLLHLLLAAAPAACCSTCCLLQHLLLAAAPAACCSTCCLLQHLLLAAAPAACCSTCCLLQHLLLAAASSCLPYPPLPLLLPAVLLPAQSRLLVLASAMQPQASAAFHQNCASHLLQFVR